MLELDVGGALDSIGPVFWESGDGSGLFGHGQFRRLTRSSGVKRAHHAMGDSKARQSFCK